MDELVDGIIFISKLTAKEQKYVRHVGLKEYKLH